MGARGWGLGGSVVDMRFWGCTTKMGPIFITLVNEWPLCQIFAKITNIFDFFPQNLPIFFKFLVNKWDQFWVNGWVHFLFPQWHIIMQKHLELPTPPPPWIMVKSTVWAPSGTEYYRINYTLRESKTDMLYMSCINQMLGKKHVKPQTGTSWCKQKQMLTIWQGDI